SRVLARCGHSERIKSGGLQPVEDHATQVEHHGLAWPAIHRKRPMSAAVAASKPLTSPVARRGSRVLLSALPNSTPHWSKELMPHKAPLTKVRCSYSATSAPNDRGVSSSSTRVRLG